ncbi:MAG: hypothetical protein LUQ50_06960 [Methanospirillum sp.]|uniref:hypothetical protein n=1 Tax=Methanospirillum sp. TaxID=45200 RepID=UPI00236B4F60|nr:hypothetical protein [Methanospirillum sp.]MDD1728793.1 hypothetical protein [Methanospirillum sp.]
MKGVSLLFCLVVLFIGTGVVCGAQPPDLNNNLSYLINSSMDLPNDTPVVININMPINVYVEKGDGFHILHIGDENLTTAIFNSTGEKDVPGYDFKNIILSEGPLAELNLTGDMGNPKPK